MVLWASACNYGLLVHDVGERTAASELDVAADNTGIPVNVSVSLVRERYRWAASDWTAGTLDEVDTESVTITPFIGQTAPVHMDLNRRTAVFEGNTKVALNQLPSGTPVRANFIGTAESPLLVSLEVLTPAQVWRLQNP